MVARVHGAFASQTPQLQGVGDRAVFGGASLALPVGVNVLEVQGDRLRLNAGPAGGVGMGAQYFVYRNGVTDFKQTDQRVAVVGRELVVEDGVVNDAESWARVVRRWATEAAIEPGAQALLFDPGQGQQRAVRLVRGGRRRLTSRRRRWPTWRRPSSRGRAASCAWPLTASAPTSRSA